MGAGMIDQELTRLRRRKDELEQRIIPVLESRTQSLFAQIMPLGKETEEREKLEADYKIQSNELRLRSDERNNIRQEIERLERLRKTRS
ncbi:MAG: hypothetical protein WD356_08380 [Pseudomonadales bacterium]